MRQMEDDYVEKRNLSVGIMQPYFLPHLPYFQLLQSVDVFVVYDNIKYTKKGWFNRNRMLRNGLDVLFSIPISKDSDYLSVRERKIPSDFNPTKVLDSISGAYRRAPFFRETFPLIEKLMLQTERNLFRYIYQSILDVCEHLDLDTVIKVSSEIEIDHNLRSQEKVIALCESQNADLYVNAIGGRELYCPKQFRQKKIDLRFISSKPFVYSQFDNNFIPNLSILDVMMFNSLDVVKSQIKSGYELLS